MLNEETKESVQVTPETQIQENVSMSSVIDFVKNMDKEEHEEENQEQHEEDETASKGDGKDGKEPKTNEGGSEDETTKSLVEKIKKKDEIIEKLKLAKKEDESKGIDEDTLDKIAKAAGLSKEQLEAALEKDEAKKAGMTLEAYKEYMSLKDKVELSEKDKDEKVQQERVENIEKIIESIVESTGVEATEKDVLEFFENVKTKYGVDLKDNPNVELAKQLLATNLGENLSNAVEQKALEKIREGEEDIPPKVKSDSKKVKSDENDELDIVRKTLEKMLK